MPFDGPITERSPAALEQDPKYIALEKHLQETRGYGFQTFYGKLLAVDTKIANEQHELTRINMDALEKTNANSRLEEAKAQRERLLGDEETRKLWQAYHAVRPDLGLGK